MPRDRVRIRPELLNTLVILRKRLKKVLTRTKPGVFGLLLEDKTHIISGCVFAVDSFSGCAPAPNVPHMELSRLIYEAHRAGMNPVGAVILNHDEGEVILNHDEGKEEYKEFIGGGGGKDGVKSARKYSWAHIVTMLKSFTLPFLLLIVDTEETPVACMIREWKNGYPHYEGFKKIKVAKGEEISPHIIAFHSRVKKIYEDM